LGKISSDVNAHVIQREQNLPSKLEEMKTKLNADLEQFLDSLRGTLLRLRLLETSSPSSLQSNIRLPFYLFIYCLSPSGVLVLETLKKIAEKIIAESVDNLLSNNRYVDMI
jgi:hypothetical protein